MNIVLCEDFFSGGGGVSLLIYCEYCQPLDY